MIRVNFPALRQPARPMLRRRDQGFTLVELMVGLAIGLIVVTALLVLFANASSSGQNLARSSIQIENGRYASELLREDLRLAGFFGEVPDSPSGVSPSGVSFTNPNPCDALAAPLPVAFSASGISLPEPVRGYKRSNAPGYVAAVDGPPCLANRKYGTAAVAIRRLATEATPAALAAGPQYYAQYSFCALDPVATPLIVGNAAASFTLRNFACAAANPVRAYVSRVYFVATCNRCSPSDDIPTLKRVDLVGSSIVTTPLVEGVEELRFEYGFDTNHDGTADKYLIDDNAPAPAGAASAPPPPPPESLWQNVMTVRAHFLVRSLERVTGAPDTAASAPLFTFGNAASGADVSTADGDGYARRAYSTTIRLVNPSGARESP